VFGSAVLHDLLQVVVSSFLLLFWSGLQDFTYKCIKIADTSSANL